MLDMVGNPEDGFSRDAAHIIQSTCVCFDADHGFNSFQIKALNTEKLFLATMFTMEITTIARTRNIK